MKTKICGITNLQDALFSITAGAWALGFNFYKPSKRYVEKSLAKEIIGKLPQSILKVGIFIDESDEEIAAIMNETGLDLAQVYKESNAPLSMKKNMILSLRPNHLCDLPDSKILNQYGYLLIDAPATSGGLYGGTGHKAQWDVACTLARDYRLILAGGLNPENVQEAIKAVYPFAVDVASGTEQSPGMKNHNLINQFLKKVQNEI
jgi:phosphoribosylanthranilate isomerase